MVIGKLLERRGFEVIGVKHLIQCLVIVGVRVVVVVLFKDSYY